VDVSQAQHVQRYVLRGDWPDATRKSLRDHRAMHPWMDNKNDPRKEFREQNIGDGGFYDAVCKQVRQMIEPVGGFVLVYVATPLEICGQRDRTGLYTKARAGTVKDFTEISDSYEPSADAEVIVNTTESIHEEAAQEVILHLERQGFIGVNVSQPPGPESGSQL
jgi:hypothetical protein